MNMLTYREKHILLESDYLGKNIMEISTKETLFALAKPLAIAGC